MKPEMTSLLGTGQTSSQSFPLIRMFMAYSQTIKRHAIGLRVWGIINFCIGCEGMEHTNLNEILVVIAIFMFALSFFLKRLRSHVFTADAIIYFVLATWNIFTVAHNIYAGANETGWGAIGFFQIAWGIAALKARSKHSAFLNALTTTDSLEKEIESASASICVKESNEQWQIRVSGKYRSMTCVDRTLPLPSVINQLLDGQIPLNRTLFRNPTDENFRSLDDQPKLKDFWSEISEPASKSVQS